MLQQKLFFHCRTAQFRYLYFLRNHCKLFQKLNWSSHKLPTWNISLVDHPSAVSTMKVWLCVPHYSSLNIPFCEHSLVSTDNIEYISLLTIWGWTPQLVAAASQRSVDCQLKLGFHVLTNLIWAEVRAWIENNFCCNCLIEELRICNKFLLKIWILSYLCFNVMTALDHLHFAS